MGDADTAPQLQKLVFGQYVMVLWADRVMALPFLTLLAPSKRFYTNKKRAPKTLLDWARQAALQIHRWLPDRYVVLVADSAFAAIEFLAAVCNCVCVVTRLRLDANLFDFPPAKHKGRGRKPIKGKPQKKLSAVLKDRKVSWKRYRVSLWYGRTDRLVEIASGTAIWYRAGVPPVPIRWLLVRDPKGELEPQAFLATDLQAQPGDILAWFVSRWQVEVTFDDATWRTPSYVIESPGLLDRDRVLAGALSEEPRDMCRRLVLARSKVP